MSDRWLQVLLAPAAPLREAMARMNASGVPLVLVVDDERRLLGTVSDGDIRRALAASADFDVSLASVMNAQPATLRAGDDPHAVLRTVRDRGVRLVPILDAGGRIVDLLDAAVLAERAVAVYPPRDRPVVVMAGGEGTRLRPLTKVLPKPLVPFGERTLVEVVMEGFARYGFDRFILTLNYLAGAVEVYFDSHTHPWAIETVREPAFLGTAGALSLVADRLPRGCVVSNCDVLVEADFDAMMSFHERGGYAATLLGVAHRMEIPYGVLEVDGERLTGITEKPSYAMLVNSGVYVLEPEVLALIEPGVRLDMPTLLDRARLQGLPIGVLPIERGWFDVGRWDQYRAALRHVLAKED